MPYSHGLPASVLSDVWLGPYMPSNMQFGTLGVPSSSAHSATDRAFYWPVRVTRPLIVYRVAWLNGATVSGNADCGLFDRVGTRLISSGSTAQAGVSVMQSVNVTDTLIGPGIFYVGFSMDNTTGTTIQRTENAPFGRFLGIFNQSSAFPLPANATFATLSSPRMIVCMVVCRPVD